MLRECGIQSYEQPLFITWPSYEQFRQVDESGLEHLSLFG